MQYMQAGSQTLGDEQVQLEFSVPLGNSNSYQLVPLLAPNMPVDTISKLLYVNR